MNKMDNTTQHADWVSALADGQLQGDDFAQALALLNDSREARATWHAYHVVGDVLRSGGSAVGHDEAGFVARLQARLVDEPCGLLTRPAELSMPLIAINSVAESSYSVRAGGQKHYERESANHASFRWKMLAGCASLVAVAAIGWNVLGVTGAVNSAGQLAQAQPALGNGQEAATTVTASAESNAQQVMIRDPHLDALMAAHKQFGGTSALQMPAGFLRNATFEGPSR
jgi:sigma-E factor negative regulatory protein RseA